jgi:nicotinamide mononucleotide adenylyltransferase
MKRHLTKQKKCTSKNEIKNKTENEINKESLVKHIINDEMKLLMTEETIQAIEKMDMKNYICEKCNKIFHNKSNLNKHCKNNTCMNKKNTMENDNVISQINNIQNIGVQNNIINININSLRGFDEDWNISNITKDMKEKLFLSDKKFTNTLENILNNDDNLNVILKDKVTGLVYKIKNNEYEAMPVKDIFEEAMDKIYKHLRDFFTEIISNNKNDIRIDILENEIKEIDKKYNKYKQSIITCDGVNNCLSNIFDEKKKEAIKQFVKVIKNDSNNVYLENKEEYVGKDY